MCGVQRSEALPLDHLAITERQLVEGILKTYSCGGVLSSIPHVGRAGVRHKKVKSNAYQPTSYLYWGHLAHFPLYRMDPILASGT